MVLPQIIAAVLLKKFVAYRVYAAVEAYGIPRAYRRLLEGMKAVNIPHKEQQLIRDHLKSGIRVPATWYNHASKETMEFAEKFADHLRSQKSNANAMYPHFFLTVAEMFSKHKFLGRTLVWFVSRNIKP
jgi:hypothetical protein